jgi:hypothetical protein
MSKPAFWHEKSAYLLAQTGQYWSPMTYVKSAFPYQSFAKNVDAKKQVMSATKLLKLSVQEKKKNTLNYALKAA